MRRGINKNVLESKDDLSFHRYETRVSAGPFVLVVVAVLTLLAAAWPSASLLAAFVPLFLFFVRPTFRPLFAACFLGNLLMLFGSAGEVEFLGHLEVSASTTSASIVFSNVMAVVLFITPGVRPRSESRLKPGSISTATHVGILAVAILLLMLRFLGGIPLLQGDSGRLTGLLSTNPYLGLFSGILPIAASFLSSKKSQLVVVLKLVVLILVIGTASRLLLGAVLVGLVTSSPLVRGGLSVKARIYLFFAGLITIFAVTKIYSARTAEGIQKIYEYRVSNIGGIAGWVTDLIGPSIFYAARNGLVIYEIVMNGDLRPPNGFIFGGILRVVNLGTDPEIWLTSALGFNVLSVGAIATPIWAGAHSDFGAPGACLIAALFGAIFSFAVRNIPELEYWAAFGILLSFYGSYLVSTQFIGASIIIVLVAVWSKRKRAQEFGLDKRSEVEARGAVQHK